MFLIIPFFAIMRTLIQRVAKADVTIDGQTKAAIGMGLLVFVGIEDTDSQVDIDKLTAKITNLRIFDGIDGGPERSVKDINGEILVISQFTLHASVKKGNRPSYLKASKPTIAIPLYEAFLHKMEIELGKPVGSGLFGADMKVSLLNDGPVTIWIDSKMME